MREFNCVSHAIETSERDEPVVVFRFETYKVVGPPPIERQPDDVVWMRLPLRTLKEVVKAAEKGKI